MPQAVLVQSQASPPCADATCAVLPRVENTQIWLPAPSFCTAAGLTVQVVWVGQALQHLQLYRESSLVITSDVSLWPWPAAVTQGMRAVGVRHVQVEVYAECSGRAADLVLASWSICVPGYW